jgi:hypothetical protein
LGFYIVNIPKNIDYTTSTTKQEKDIEMIHGTLNVNQNTASKVIFVLHYA